MKTILRFTLALALAALVGCSENQQPVTPQANDTPQNLTANSPSAAPVDLTKIKAEFDRRVAEHQERLAQAGSTNSLAKKKPKITVPDDYATIQEAVDNAPAGAEIKVEKGDYNGDIVVSTANLKIKASGNVTLTGGFILTANGIEIEGFKIVNTGFAGITGSGISGVEVEDNNVSGGIVGIVFWSNTDCTIKDNTLSGSDLGIVLDHSNGNTIDDNTASRNSAIGIQLQNDCDDNEVSGNTCESNGRDGITLLYSCDRNQVKDNVSNGNMLSGFVLNDSHNNTIGAENKANANGDVGILLLGNASGNTVKKNTAHSNANCDIVDAGGGTGNVFIKNRTGCTGGF